MTQLCHGSRSQLCPGAGRTTPIRDGARRMGNWVIVDVWLFWRLLETLAWPHASGHAPSFTKQSQQLLSICYPYPTLPRRARPCLLGSWVLGFRCLNPRSPSCPQSGHSWLAYLLLVYLHTTFQKGRPSSAPAVPACLPCSCLPWAAPACTSLALSTVAARTLVAAPAAPAAPPVRRAP